MTVRMRLPALIACLCALLMSHPAAAQSFDNFDGEALDGFEFGTEGMDDLDAPSLSDDNGFGIGPDIDLEQGIEDTDSGLITVPGSGRPVTTVSQPETEGANRVVLRALDKMLGRPTDIELMAGETVIYGRIAIRLIECRYPVDNPTSDAFAQLEIFDLQGNSLFDGWMVGSSPALNALEHARYDVWVLRCVAPE